MMNLSRYFRVAVVILALCTIVLSMLALLNKVPATWAVVFALITATINSCHAYLDRKR